MNLHQLNRIKDAFLSRYGSCSWSSGSGITCRARGWFGDRRCNSCHILELLNDIEAEMKQITEAQSSIPPTGKSKRLNLGIEDE